MKRKGKLIYLAGPYSHPEEGIRLHRFHELTKVAGKFIEDGHVVFSPITHSHTIQEHYTLGGDTSFEFWKHQDLTILSRCDELVIVMLEGWDKSIGVAGELEFAWENQIPIKLLNPKTNQILNVEHYKTSEVVDASVSERA